MLNFMDAGSWYLKKHRTFIRIKNVSSTLKVSPDFNRRATADLDGNRDILKVRPVRVEVDHGHDKAGPTWYPWRNDIVAKVYGSVANCWKLVNHRHGCRQAVELRRDVRNVTCSGLRKKLIVKNVLKSRPNLIKVLDACLGTWQCQVDEIINLKEL